MGHIFNSYEAIMNFTWMVEGQKFLSKNKKTKNSRAERSRDL